MEYMLSRFTHVYPDLSAEASELGVRPGVAPYGALYPDAADLGIKIRSDKTDKVFTFVLDEDCIETGPMAWCFRPVEDECPINKVIIFND